MLFAIISAAVVAVVSSQATQITGTDDSMTIQIPGAQLTLQASNNCGNTPTDPLDFTQATFVKEAIDAAVSSKISGYATTSDMTSTAKPLAGVDDVGVMEGTVDAAVQKLMSSTVDTINEDMMNKTKEMDSIIQSLPSIRQSVVSFAGGLHCNSTSTKMFCPSGDANGTIRLYGAGLIISPNNLYQIKVTTQSNDVAWGNCTAQYTSWAASRQIVDCVLPAVFNDKLATFDADIQLYEGGVFEVKNSFANPAITFYNTLPTLGDLQNNNFALSGSSSSLVNGKLVVQLSYDDFYDKWEDLQASISGMDNSIFSSATVDTDTRNATFTFTNNYVANFVDNNDADYVKATNFTLTVTEKSHSGSTSGDFTLNLIPAVLAFNASGQAHKYMSNAALAELKGKAGYDSDQEFEMCYSADRDGWSSNKIEEQCSKNKQVMIMMKTVRGDRVFGWHTAYNWAPSTYCRRVYNIGNLGLVDGESNWLFTVLQSNHTIDYAYTKNKYYTAYRCPNSFLMNAGSYEAYCYNYACYCNVGSYTFRTESSNNPDNTWCFGNVNYEYFGNAANWKSDFTFFEAYVLP